MYKNSDAENDIKHNTSGSKKDQNSISSDNLVARDSAVNEEFNKYYLPQGGELDDYFEPIEDVDITAELDEAAHFNSREDSNIEQGQDDIVQEGVFTKEEEQCLSFGEPVQGDVELDPPTSIVNNDTIFVGCPKVKKTSWFIMFAIFFGIYFVASTFCFQILCSPIAVEGSSMYPTINADTTANDTAYVHETKNITYGDVIVLQALHYTGADSLYIKRVVALAGDRVRYVDLGFCQDPDNPDSGAIKYKEYALYINGVRQYETYINKETANAGTMCLRYEHANAIYYNTVIQGVEFTIPDGCVYVLGDNRRVSNDSKYFGPVKLEDVVGKMVILLRADDWLWPAIIKSIKDGYLF